MYSCIGFVSNDDFSYDFYPNLTVYSGNSTITKIVP